MSTDSSNARVRIREQDLAGKVAVITGASRGIGRATALHLASRGCSILGTCSSAQTLHLIDVLDQHVKDLFKGSPHAVPKVVGIEANVFYADAATKIAEAVEKHFQGHANIFINNAAAADAQAIGEITDEHIQQSLCGNIEVPVRIVEEFVKRKIFRPQSRIIHVSSVRARKAWADQSMYMATKAAGEALCRAWSDAFGGKYAQYEFMAGTTANTVIPTMTRTEAVYSLPTEVVKKFEDEFLGVQSIPRIPSPEDVADVIGLLCRDEAGIITGHVVGADAGAVKIL